MRKLLLRKMNLMQLANQASKWFQQGAFIIDALSMNFDMSKCSQSTNITNTNKYNINVSEIKNESESKKKRIKERKMMRSTSEQDVCLFTHG